MRIGKILYRNKYLESRLFFLFILIVGVIILYSTSGMLSLWEIVYAHSLPVTKSPAPDSIIKKGDPLPSKVVIDFSERPEPAVSTITVLNGRNERVDNGNFVIVGDHSREAMTTLNTKKLTDGVYTVSWMTQSADDGHIARGSYVFGIGNIGPGAADESAFSLGGANQQHSQVQTVTSNWDGLIKWPLIVSQATVVGAIFSHLFLWEKFVSKIRTKVNGHGGLNTAPSRRMDIPVFKRFTMLLVGVSVVIIGSSTGLLFLQITELSPNNISGYATIFISLLHGPSGFAWLVRSITSFVVILAAITNYYLVKKNRINRIDDYDQSYSQRQLKYDRTKKRKILFPSSLLLYLSLTAGSISIFANSATSHNSAVTFIPSLAVSLDWLHFMAVSMWVGGLFYISAILLTAIRDRAKSTIDESDIQETSKLPNRTLPYDVKKSQAIHYYLALLLPRFSLVATVSLGVIGISGLYMAWIQLTTLDALFSTAYGNILIVKLAVALPLILLGGYHQLKIHNAVVSVARLGKIGGRDSMNTGGNRDLQLTHDCNDNNNADNADDIVESPRRQTKQKKTLKLKANRMDISTKFGKTIKIESLLAICVLLVASLLTITSPNPMSMSSMSMGSSSPSPYASTVQTAGMSTNNAKNSSYVQEVKILNVNTKIEINPFYSGFNTFKITFTDAGGKPYSKLSTVRMIFKNDHADIGPITTNLKPVSTGVYTITGGYVSQPGEWNIAIAAQTPSDYDLNYRFISKVNSSSSMVTHTGGSITNPMTNAETTSAMTSNANENIPVFDSFTVITIGLAAIVAVGSFYFYKRSKQELKKTIELLEPE
jgi:copper transport protein